MVTIAKFRELALSFNEATEEPHFEKASFRIKKKIFATLDEAKHKTSMKLPEAEQSVYCAMDKDNIAPATGAWGRQGWTMFNLQTTKTEIIKEALALAYNTVAPASVIKKSKIPAKSTEPTFFPTPPDFRKWLAKNHKIESELLVGYYTVGSGKASITWSQSVDQALCYGWIDGVRRNIDSESYSIRFTPRKAKSIWSAVNLKKIEELKEAGLMAAAGMAAWELRTDDKSKIYSYEMEPAVFPVAMEQQFKALTGAWAFFEKQAPSYRRTATHWVMCAKQEATTQKRMEELIKDSGEGRRLKHLTPLVKKKQ